jgi:hypothetical protein
MRLTLNVVFQQNGRLPEPLDFSVQVGREQDL